MDQSTPGSPPDACLRAAGGVEWAWAEEAYLREHLSDVAEEERPLWFPEDQIPQDAIDASSAIALRSRPG